MADLQDNGRGAKDDGGLKTDAIPAPLAAEPPQEGRDGGMTCADVDDPTAPVDQVGREALIRRLLTTDECLKGPTLVFDPDCFLKSEECGKTTPITYPALPRPAAAAG